MEAYEMLLEDLIIEFELRDKEKLLNILGKYDVALKEKDAGKDLQQKIDMFLDAKRIEGLSPRTIGAYALQLRLFKDYVQKPVDKITTPDVRQYIRQSAHLAANTINSKLVAIRTFFQFLVDEEFLERNPAAKSKIKPAKVPKRMPKAMSPEELELMREACETVREKALVEILYSTGGRVSEVHHMNRDDVDFRKQNIRVIGKGNKEGIVNFNIKALLFLKKYLSSRKDDNPALFVTDKAPHNRLGVRSIERSVEAIRKKSGVKTKCTPHTFRHTLATHMLENGADLGIVQEVLRHESPATTQIYAQRSEQKKAENYRRYAGQ